METMFKLRKATNTDADRIWVIIQQAKDQMYRQNKQRGIATLFMQEVETLSREKGVHSFKVDTNFDNFFMHKILERLGFSYCGEIIFEGGSRMAYEKLL